MGAPEKPVNSGMVEYIMVYSSMEYYIAMEKNQVLLGAKTGKNFIDVK